MQTLKTRTHTHHMNTRTKTLPLWAPPKDWTGRSGDSRSHHWRLVVDGNVAYHLTHNAGKFWNKSRKVRAPVPSRGLKLEWIGSTIRDLTNWSMISSRVQVFICTIVLSTIYIDIELMMNNPIYKILERQKVSKRKDRKASHCPFWTKKRKSYKRRSDSFICCLGRVYKHTHFTFGSIQAKKHTMVHVGHMRWTQKIHKPSKQNQAVHVLIKCRSPYP